MPKRKIADSKLEKLVSFIKEREVYLEKDYYKNSRAELCKKFNISTSVASGYINTLIEKGLLTEKERSVWEHDKGLRMLRMDHKRYGSKLYGQMMKDLRDNGIGSNPKKLKSAATLGGLYPQKKHKHVQENLKNARMYSP